MKPTLPTSLRSSSRRTPRGGREQAKLNSHIRALQAQVTGLELQLAALHQSTSWRVSAPLRWLSQRLRPGGAPVDATVPRHAESYAEWVRLYDSPAPGTPDAFCVEMKARPQAPSISVVIEGTAGRAAPLLATAASLAAQGYANWDVVVVVADAGAVAELETNLARAGLAKDRVTLHPAGQGQSAAQMLNGAMALARGQWLLLVEPGTVLPSYALCHIASEIDAHADARIIYTDEDSFDPQGRRSDPWFKPDWDPELFHSQDLVSHLAVIEKRVVVDAGGFREGFDPAMVYDLALRVAEHLRPDQIRHIPRVLCHRPHQGTDAARTRDAEVRALEDLLVRTGIAAQVLDTPEGRRVRYELPADPPLVSLIVPTRNALGLVRQCVESIVMETTYPNYEILLVDNGSDDAEALAYFDQLRRQPGITVIRDERPFNYSALNNMAVARARGDVIGLVNNDIEVISPEWLDEMVSLALQPGVGAVGAKLLYPDETVQHGGVLLGVGGIAGHAHRYLSAWDDGGMRRSRALQSFSAVTAACLVVRKALYEQVGGLNEVELKVGFNDVDFCLKLREAGYRNLWSPHALLFHHESATRGSDLSPERRERFEQEQAYMRSRWGALLARDPAYNPNLTVHAEDFGLAWPPRVPWLAGAAKP